MPVPAIIRHCVHGTIRRLVNGNNPLVQDEEECRAISYLVSSSLRSYYFEEKMTMTTMKICRTQTRQIGVSLVLVGE